MSRRRGCASIGLGAGNSLVLLGGAEGLNLHLNFVEEQPQTVGFHGYCGGKMQIVPINAIAGAIFCNRCNYRKEITQYGTLKEVVDALADEVNRDMKREAQIKNLINTLGV